MYVIVKQENGSRSWLQTREKLIPAILWKSPYVEIRTGYNIIHITSKRVRFKCDVLYFYKPYQI